MLVLREIHHFCGDSIQDSVLDEQPQFGFSDPPFAENKGQSFKLLEVDMLILPFQHRGDLAIDILPGFFFEIFGDGYI